MPSGPGQSRRSLELLVLAACLVAAGAAGPAALGQAGVELVEVSGQAALEAGLEPGHRLTSAVPAPGLEERTIASPFELELLAAERASFGGVVLRGSTPGEDRKWRLGPGPWGLRSAPSPLPPALDAAYREALDDDSGPDVVRALGARIAGLDDLEPEVAAWAWSEVGRLAARRLDSDTARDAWGRALERLAGSSAAWREDATVLVRLARGRAAIGVSDWELAREDLGAAGELVEPESLLHAAVLDASASRARAVGELDEAERLWNESLRIREGAAPGSYLVASTLGDLAQLALNRDDAERGAELAARALELQRAAGLELQSAESLRLLARAAGVRDQLDDAEAMLAEVEEILSRLAPESSGRTATFVQRGMVAQRRGRIDEAERHFEAALALAERFEPRGVGLPSILNNLGVIAWRRGNLALAEARWRDAVERLEAIAPENHSLAIFLSNLATATKARGDYVTAEELYRRVLELRRRFAPGAKTVGGALNNIGGMRKDRGDLDGAERYYREALAIHQALAPKGLDVALVLVNLAQIERERGGLDEAERLLLRSLEIRQRLAPGSGPEATSHANLGSLALERGDLEEAERRFATALELRQRQAPGGLDVAVSLQDLGRLAARRGDHAAAEERHGEALAIRQRLAPGTLREAESWHHVGTAQRAAGRLDDAERSLCRAADVLDRLEPRVAAAEDDRATFRAEFADYYRDCLDAQVEAGRPDLAFATLERSRARSLLLQLSERDLELGDEIPADLAAALRDNRVEADRTLGSLARIDDRSAPEEAEALADRLAVLREERIRLLARLRERSPRLARLQAPEPLDWQGAAAALDPGTALLAYSVGEARALLFVVRGGADDRPPPPLEVFTVPLRREALDREVRALREAVARRRLPDPELDRLSAELHAALLAPAEPLLAGAERLVVSPDGPLHVLPFAALAPAPAEGDRPRFVVERWPIRYALSATVYRELQEGAPTAGPLLAFGDPQPWSGGSVAADEGLRAFLGPIGELQPLPWARREIDALESMFAGRARVFVGAEASEARAKELAPGAGYLHFATHGLLSERFPLSSALRLSEGGEENGLLEAWEVIEQLRLDARLVTLSACETALGRELGGEGLIGLTRAFQLAGARSVLASLWRVADRATAELMRRTYARIVEGASLDRALRDAQLALIRGEGGKPVSDSSPEETRAVGGLAPGGAQWRHPFYWAAFQLHGDGR